MENQDFQPTNPEFMSTRPEGDYMEHDDVVVNLTKEEYLHELEEHKKSLQILEEQSKDPSRSEEERKERWGRWINEKIDLEQKEELLAKGKILFRAKA